MEFFFFIACAIFCTNPEKKIIRRKLRYENLPPDKRPSTVAAAIKECDPLHFPNIRVLLKIACMRHHTCHFL